SILCSTLLQRLVYDPFDAATLVDPYPVYARLRDDDPVHFVEEDGVWAVSRYDDVVALLREPGAFSSSAMRDFMTGGVLRRQRSRNPCAAAASVIWGDSRALLSTDPPDRTVLRRLPSRSFTPRATDVRRSSGARACDALLYVF